MLPHGPGWIVANWGHSSDAIRTGMWRMGARPAIPARANEAPVRRPDFIYRHRNEVERLWGRLKEGRAVATRHEKLARPFMSVLCLAATLDWPKP